MFTAEILVLPDIFNVVPMRDRRRDDRVRRPALPRRRPPPRDRGAVHTDLARGIRTEDAGTCWDVRRRRSYQRCDVARIRWSLRPRAAREESGGRMVRKAALVFCSVDRNERAARDRLRHTLAYILRGGHHAHNLELAGTRLDQAALAQAYAQEDWTRVEALVTDDVLRRHSASGTPAQVLAALSAYRDVGLDEIVAYGVHDGRQMADVLAAMRP